MMAILDSRQTGADYSGGVSDPRLVGRLNLLPVRARDITPEVSASARRMVDNYVGREGLSAGTAGLLAAMIFGDGIQHAIDHELKEAA
jgi:hypothetical protein